MSQTITTTAKEPFTLFQSAELAHLIWLRFGRDDRAATEAWLRLLENDTTIGEFVRLRTLTLAQCVGAA